MRLKTVLILVLTLLIHSKILPGALRIPLDVFLVEQNIQLEDVVPNFSSEQPILILLEANKSPIQSRINTQLLGQIIKLKLDKVSYPSSVYSGDYRPSFLNRDLNINSLLAPKLVLDIELEEAKEEIGYHLNARLAFIEYHTSKASDDKFNPHLSWNNSYQLSGGSVIELEEQLVSNVQKDLDRLIDTKLMKKKTPASSSRLKLHPSRESQSLVYSVEWLGEGSRNFLLRGGVTAGLPRVLNLNVSVWGPAELPINFAISGMMFSQDRRWAQFNVGYVFDRLGDTKQSVGTSFAVLDQHFEGESTSGALVKSNGHEGYLGPSYFATYKSFSLQAGVMFRISRIDATFHPWETPSVHALLQLGYTPTLLQF